MVGHPVFFSAVILRAHIPVGRDLPATTTFACTFTLQIRFASHNYPFLMYISYAHFTCEYHGYGFKTFLQTSY